MTSHSTVASAGSFRLGWMLVLVVGALAALAGLYVLAVPVDEGQFASATGVVWSEFSAGNPDVAANIEFLNRLLGIASVAFAAFALAVTWGWLRMADPRAARVMWILPLAIGAWAVLFLADGGAAISTFYLAMTIAAVAGLLLVMRTIRQPRSSTT